MPGHNNARRRFFYPMYVLEGVCQQNLLHRKMYVKHFLVDLRGSYNRRALLCDKCWGLICWKLWRETRDGYGEPIDINETLLNSDFMDQWRPDTPDSSDYDEPDEYLDRFVDVQPGQDDWAIEREIRRDERLEGILRDLADM